MEIAKQQTLKEVQLAIESVEEARSAPDLKNEDKRILESVLLKLSNIEQAIIREIGENLVLKLTTDTKELNELVVKINKSTESLSIIAKKIGKATEFVNVLIKALSAAGKLI